MYDKGALVHSLITRSWIYTDRGAEERTLDAERLVQGIVQVVRAHKSQQHLAYPSVGTGNKALLRGRRDHIPRAPAAAITTPAPVAYTRESKGSANTLVASQSLIGDALAVQGYRLVLGATAVTQTL